MTTVACVLKLGGDFDAAWVHALRRGLDLHMPKPYRFVCLTDDPGLLGEPWAVPLAHDWPGWFCKFNLFDPNVFEDGEQVLAMDLDTLPVGDLSEIASYAGDFAMIRGFYSNKGRQSGVMAFRAGGVAASGIWDHWTEDPAGHMRSIRGDGEWLDKHLGRVDILLDMYPGQIVSLKVHAMQGAPKGARLVAGHGKPRFSDPRAGWAHAEWKKRADDRGWMPPGDSEQQLAPPPVHLAGDYQTATRMAQKLQAIPLPDFTGKTVLDVGCDHGAWCRLAADGGAARVLGLDRGRKVRGPGFVDLVERNRAQGWPRCEFEYANVGREWPRFGRFDVIFALSIYHHLFQEAGDHDAIWRWLAEHTAPDGLLIWEGPVDTRDVIAKSRSVMHSTPYTREAILEAARRHYDVEHIGPAIHREYREVWFCRPVVVVPGDSTIGTGDGGTSVHAEAAG